MAARPAAQHSGGNAAPDFTQETDLVLGRFGGQIIFATDEWFAVADNLLNHEPAVFINDKYTEYGKWMDGWESRRKRIAGHDWCLIRLAFPGRIVGVDVDTSFFTGNHSPRVSIQAATIDDPSEELKALEGMRRDGAWPSGGMGTCASDKEMKLAEAVGSDQWAPLVPFTPLQPGYADSCHNYFPVEDNSQRYTHLRLNMFPDGGIARLRVYGHVARDWTRVPSSEVLDLVGVSNGGTALGCSDRHFGHPRNLINPGRGINMGDGWETARKLTRPAVLEAGEGGLIKVPGSDWSVLRLGHPGLIQELEVDTCHFKGNFPESCMVEGVLLPQVSDGRAFLEMQEQQRVEWRVLLPRVKLGADRQVRFSVSNGELGSLGPVSHLRLTMYPDGGISRLRAFGTKANGGSRL